MLDKLRRWRESPAIFLLPTVATLLAVTIYPTVYGIWLSFNKMSQGAVSTTKFVGLLNYIQLFRQSDIRESLANTLIFVAGSVTLSILVGFFMALFLDRPFFGKSLYLGLFVLPIVATPVAAGMMFKLMLSTDFGVVNYVLSFVGLKDIAWLAKGSTAMLSIIFVDVWKWSPFVMYLMLAALGSLPKEVDEAAVVDGANIWQLVWRIKLPQLLPAFVAVLLVRVIDAFKAFDHILVMTQGGPGRATEVLNLSAYLIGFRYFDLAKAAALGLLVLILVTIVSQVITRVLRTE